MPGVERIDSVYNIAAITGEHDQLQKILQQDATALVRLYENLEQFQGKSNVATVAKNWQNVTSAMTGAATASDALIQIQKQLNDQIQKSADLEKQLADAINKGTTTRKKNSDLTKEEIQQKYEDTKATKDRTKEAISELDAYKKLEFQRDQAAAKAKTLQATALQTGNPQDVEAANKASAEANSMTNALKRIDQTVGESRRKVGDYTGALRILEEELAQVNLQMENIRKSGNDAGGVLPKLAQQSEALSVVIGQQGKGFSSTSAQIRSSVKALDTLRAAGLGASQGFKTLEESTADARREQKDFLEAQKLLADNLPIIKSITIAAKALAGAYALGQGAAAIFADGNEKVEKELNKLVAIMTILQGLQEIHELLEKSNAIATIFRSAATKAGVAITGVDTAATLENATVKYQQAQATLAAAEGEAAQTVAMEALTVAEIELTAATEASTGAISGLITVIGATGLGLVIVAVGAAIVFLVMKMKEWTAETELSIKQQKELNDALSEQISNYQKIADLQDKAGKRGLADLQHQLELEEKSGQNQYAIFAIKEKIAAKNAEIADNKYTLALSKAEDTYVKEGLIGVDALHRAQNDYFENLTDKSYKVSVVQKELNNALAMSDKQRKQKDIKVDDIKERLEAAKAEEKIASDTYDYYTKAEEDKTNTTNEQENIRTEKAKFAADERRKYILESTKLEAAGITDSNERVLSDFRSSLTARLEAVKSNAQQERRVAVADYNDVKNDPGSTDTQRLEAFEKLQSELTKITKDASDKRRDIVYSYYVRDRDAQVEIFKLEQQDQQARAQKILDDEKSTGDQRITARLAFYDTQRRILGAEFLKELDQEGMTEEERLKIIAKYNSDILNLNIDHERNLEEEQKIAKQRQLDQLDKFYQKQRDKTIVSQTQQGAGLNDQLLSGQIGPGEFERKRKEQQYNDQKELAQQQVAQQFALTQLYKEGTQERADAEAALAKAQMDLSNLVTDHELENIKKVKELREEAAQESAHAVVSLIDASFERELNNVQKLIDQNNKYKEQQTNRIAESTLGEQEKANALNVINRQTEANNEALQRRQRDIKVRQAKFDRDVAVAETIEQGAIAAIAALKIPIYGQAEAIAIGIITAAKVTEILARPLPTYGFGTEDHVGGPAWVGDRFQREYIQEPGKPGYWSPGVPTILDLPAHTQVIPPSEIERMRSENMFINDRGVLIVNDKKENTGKVIAEAIGYQTERLEKAFKQQRKNTSIHIDINTKWGEYLQKSLH